MRLPFWPAATLPHAACSTISTPSAQRCHIMMAMPFGGSSNRYSTLLTRGSKGMKTWTRAFPPAGSSRGWPDRIRAASRR